MKACIGLVALGLLAAPHGGARAQSSAPSPAVLAEALKDYGVSGVSADDIRAVGCEVASQAPDALDCRWEQRTGGEWRAYTTWLAHSGSAWSVVDAPLIVPAFDRGRLKPLATTEAP
jgi:hypothetical protein